MLVRNTSPFKREDAGFESLPLEFLSFMMLQLDPPIPLITPKGKGFAHFVIDYGQEHHLMWVVFIDETGECWSFQNPEIKIQNNASLGRIKNESETSVKAVD